MPSRRQVLHLVPGQTEAVRGGMLPSTLFFTVDKRLLSYESASIKCCRSYIGPGMLTLVSYVFDRSTWLEQT